MTHRVVVEEWKVPLLKQEVMARARYIASLEQSQGDQLKLAKAYINSLFGGIHGPGFARRIAWGISEREDTEKLRAAAEEMGMERVVRSIISQTKPYRVTPDKDSDDKGHADFVIWVLPAQGGVQKEDLVIIQRTSDTVHLSEGATIRRRLPDDPKEWFVNP